MAATSYDRNLAQLTAPGVGSSIPALDYKYHTFQVTLAASDTNVVVRVEGSADGTNFFTLPLKSTPVTGMAIAVNQATLTIDGSYGLIVDAVKVKEIRLRFVSESGGTAATVDSHYFAGN